MSVDLTVIEGGTLARHDDTPDAEKITRSLEKRLCNVVEIRWDDACERAVSVDIRDGISEDRQRRAREYAESFLTPAPITVIVAELTRLRKVTSARGQPEQDWSAMLRLYSEHLAAYPVDAIQYACRRGGHEWWPPVEALRKKCEQLVATRRLIADALRRPARQRIAQAERQPPTAEDIAAVDELVTHMRGVLTAATVNAKAAQLRPEPAPRRPRFTSPPLDEEDDEAELGAFEATKAKAIAELANGGGG